MKISILTFAFFLFSLNSFAYMEAENMSRLLAHKDFVAHIEVMKAKDFSLLSIKDTMAGLPFFVQCDCQTYEVTFQKSVETKKPKAGEFMGTYKQVQEAYTISVNFGEVAEIEKIK